MIFHVLRKKSPEKKISTYDGNHGALNEFDVSTKISYSVSSWSELLVLLTKLRVENPKWIPSESSVFCKLMTPLGYQINKQRILNTANLIHSNYLNVGDVGSFVGQVIMALGDDADPFLVVGENETKTIRELGL